MVIVILFIALPEAYRALSIVLFTPFHLVLVGIVLRGASSGGATALLVALLLPLIAWQAPTLWEHLALPQSFPFLVAGAALAGLSAWAIRGRLFTLGLALAVAPGPSVRGAVLRWGRRRL